MQSAWDESGPKLSLTTKLTQGLEGPGGPNRADFLRSKGDSSEATHRACTSDPHEQTVRRRRPGRPGRRGSPCGASCWPWERPRWPKRSIIVMFYRQTVKLDYPVHLTTTTFYFLFCKIGDFEIACLFTYQSLLTLSCKMQHFKLH